MVKINLELMGSLADYLPDAKNGIAKISLEKGSSIADLLVRLKIKRKVIVSVNGEEEKELEYMLSDGDDIIVFTVMSGG